METLMSLLPDLHILLMPVIISATIDLVEKIYTYGMKLPCIKRWWLKKYKSKYHSDKSVWYDLVRGKSSMARPLKNMSDLCIEILKDGKIITQGVLTQYDTGVESPTDFLLTDVENVSMWLADDKNKEKEEKMFPEIVCEYYNAEHNIVIKMYDSTKWANEFSGQN